MASPVFSAGPCLSQPASRARANRAAIPARRVKGVVERVMSGSLWVGPRPPAGAGGRGFFSLFSFFVVTGAGGFAVGLVKVPATALAGWLSPLAGSRCRRRAQKLTRTPTVRVSRSVSSLLGATGYLALSYSISNRLYSAVRPTLSVTRKAAPRP